MQVEDVDIDEVQCILANLIYMVSGPSLPHQVHNLRLWGRGLKAVGCCEGVFC